mgnify:CR=1 FL=1
MIHRFSQLLCFSLVLFVCAVVLPGAGLAQDAADAAPDPVARAVELAAERVAEKAVEFPVTFQ